jgi:nucleoside-diphosphate-sugar epimerase
MNKQLIIDQKPARKGDQERTSAVIDKARILLGYEPKVTFKKGLEQQVKWYLDKFTS